MNKKQVNKPSYPTFSEYRRKEFINIATAVSVGVAAVSIPFSVNCEQKTTEESKKDKTKSYKKEKEQIIILVSKLGNEDFKKREEATQSLISIGKKLQKSKNSDMIKFYTSKLVESKKSKDPEVRKRVLAIILALTPKVKVRPNPPILMGEARPPRINR